MAERIIDIEEAVSGDRLSFYSKERILIDYLLVPRIYATQ
jgi:hypothetical protein